VLTRTPKPNTEWISIELPDGAGTLELQLRKPSYSALVRDMELVAGFMARRLDECVVGWKGVTWDDGTQAPWSLDNFHKLCEAFPVVIQKLIPLMNTWYLGLGDEHEKNSLRLLTESSALDDSDGSPNPTPENTPDATGSTEPSTSGSPSGDTPPS
jgi:hypothetical protein